MPLIPREYSAHAYTEGTYGYLLYDVNIVDVGTGAGGLFASARPRAPHRPAGTLVTSRMAPATQATTPLASPRPRRIG